MATARTRKQGPKRSEASRRAILEATRHELAETGWRRFSVDSVAKKASASKQTIYRWWPSIGAMCVEAGLEILPETTRSGRDPIERISEIFLPLETTARGEHAVLRGSLIAASDDVDGGERWRAWLQETRRTPLRMVMAELAAKRIVQRDWSIETAMDVMLGPFWHRLLMMRAPIEYGYCRTQAAALLKLYETR